MKKIISILTIFSATGIVVAQTNTENYIQTRTYLEPVITPTPGAKKIETVQYFDFLGRPKQVVDVKNTPLGKDIVTPILYDEQGRQARNYFPVPQTTMNNGSIYPQNNEAVAYPVPNASEFYGAEKLYSEKLYDTSQRLIQQKQPGNDWNNKPVNFGYDFNSDNEVRKFSTITSWQENSSRSSLTIASDTYASKGYYGANQLLKNTVTNEDENTTIEFKDWQGNTVLVRKVNGSENADTYYIYNEFGLLVYTLSPKASEAIKALAAGAAIPDAILNDLCYQYRYDGKNRLVEKKLPGKSWEYMVYNKADQLILTQDTVLKDKGQWLFTKYDQFGRTAYTGITNNPANRASMQNSINTNANLYETRTATAGWTLNGMSVYYTKLSTPTSVSQVLSVNYYDTYPTGSPAVTNVFAQPLLTDNPANAQTTKGLLTASYIKNIEDDKWTHNFIWYDTKGRSIGSRSNNHLGGYTVVNNKLDFSGIVLQSNTYHKRLAADPEKIIAEKFTYDSQNRLLSHTHQIGSSPIEYLTQNKYNEISKLESKKVGGTAAASPLQTIVYQYNIRGWITKVNDPVNMGNNLFGYKINYNQVEGLTVPNSNYQDLKVKPRYDGSIAEVSWKTLTEDNEPLKRYGYVYDGFNRLSAGFYQKAGNETAGEYFEKLEYDLNGNITRLKRSEGASAASNIATVIDNLKYDYAGNRLIRVTDEQQNPSGYPYLTSPNTITYDDNGNMVTHLDKGISSIQYNYLNLSKQIVQNSKVINYTYRADGAKVKKIFETITTDYLNGFQYDNEILKFFPTAEGFYNFERKEYVYHYTDHLGNIRLSYSKADGGGVTILEENNYYPFGLKHQGYHEGSLLKDYGTNYNYKFGGKELQETGMYDFGARMYMPDLGRWGVADPLEENMRRHSPYNYAFNNPISFVDPDGREPVQGAVAYFEGADAIRFATQLQGISSAMASSPSDPEPGFFSEFDFSGFGKYDWVRRKDGSIYWDKNANDYFSTKIGEVYLGKEIGMTFNSYIDEKLWDGPNSKAPGDKLTTTIILTGRENSEGELTSLVGTSSIVIGRTPIGTARDYYPGEGGNNNVFNMKTTSTGINVNFEQHASVPWQEHFAINAMGLKIVDVAQKLDINYNKNNGNLSIDAYTNIFPSATLYVQGTVAMQYNQPSFMKSHAIPPVKGIRSTPRGITAPKTNTSNYPSKFYKRN